MNLSHRTTTFYLFFFRIPENRQLIKLNEAVDRRSFLFWSVCSLRFQLSVCLCPCICLAFLYFHFISVFTSLSVCSPSPPPTPLGCHLVDVGLFGNCKPSEWHGGTRAVGLLLHLLFLPSSISSFEFLSLSSLFFFFCYFLATPSLPLHSPPALFVSKKKISILCKLLPQILRFLVALTCCTLSNDGQLSATNFGTLLSTGHVIGLQVRNRCCADAIRCYPQPASCEFMQMTSDIHQKVIQQSIAISWVVIGPRRKKRGRINECRSSWNNE